MGDYIIKRFSQMVFVLVMVSVFSFSIIYFAPGDPLYMYTTPSASNYKLSDEQLDSMRQSLGLNGNIVEQYTSWAKKNITRKLGTISK